MMPLTGLKWVIRSQVPPQAASPTRVASCWDAVHRLNDDGSASVTEAGLRYSRVALETEHRIAEFFTVP